jgi:hypothetical protein
VFLESGLVCFVAKSVYKSKVPCAIAHKKFFIEGSQADIGKSRVFPGDHRFASAFFGLLGGASK